MIELDLYNETSISLEMEIEGDTNPSETPLMRFSIKHPKYVISFVAKNLSNGAYEIQFPAVKGLLEAGEYDADIEILIAGRYFVPLSEKVKVKNDIKPVVKLTQQSDKSDKNVSVEIKKVTTKKQLKKSNEIVSV